VIRDGIPRNLDPTNQPQIEKTIRNGVSSLDDKFAKMKDIWMDVLALKSGDDDQVLIHKSFEDLGGDSVESRCSVTIRNRRHITNVGDFFLFCSLVGESRLG
jgi:hypothetical protein